MSRIGNTPVAVLQDVSVEISASGVLFKGPKGELRVVVPSGIAVAREGDMLRTTRTRNDRSTKALHGTISALMKNSMIGVITGWTKQLELSGVGYRVALNGADISLTVGFSHPVTMSPPKGITFQVTEGKIVVSGIDKHMVGQTAASIRGIKPPEPYKGKGIKYTGEHIRKKAGKSAKAVGGAPGAK